MLYEDTRIQNVPIYDIDMRKRNTLSSQCIKSLNGLNT